MSRETRDAPATLVAIEETGFPPLEKGDQGGFLGFLTILELFLHIAKRLQFYAFKKHIFRIVLETERCFRRKDEYRSGPPGAWQCAPRPGQTQNR